MRRPLGLPLFALLITIACVAAVKEEPYLLAWVGVVALLWISA